MSQGAVSVSFATNIEERAATPWSSSSSVAHTLRATEEQLLVVVSDSPSRSATMGRQRNAIECGVENIYSVGIVAELWPDGAPKVIGL